ncbi:MAG: ATPase domain-containing protein, partial [Moraxellaceae bacterium]
MSKLKTSYVCQSCGSRYPKWAGQCTDCGEWNSLIEEKAEPAVNHRAKPKTGGYAGQAASVTRLNQVSVSRETRMTTGIGEFDRVLGGGLVTGSVVLIGGDPGIGKSTILLQTATHMAQHQDTSALYITGEESLSQVALRASRLELPADRLNVMAETCVETICATLHQEQPAVAILDSIQTLYTETLQSAPGGVAQIRESAALLTRYAKQTGTA